MPLVRIETRKGLSADQKSALLDALHDALVTAFEIPHDDRRQRFIEYDPEHFVATGKGPHFTIVTIDAFAGRSLEAKRRLYREMAAAAEHVGIPANDLVVVVHDVQRESWGVRGGQAASDVDIGFEIEV